MGADLQLVHQGTKHCSTLGDVNVFCFCDRAFHCNVMSDYFKGDVLFAAVNFSTIYCLLNTCSKMVKMLCVALEPLICICNSKIKSLAPFILEIFGE